VKLLKKAGRFVVDIIEVHLPIVIFVALFLAFLLNVFFRYVLRNPQNWTFEFSIIAFAVVGLLGACTAYRSEDHVVFDLFYTRLGAKGQNILRIISYILVILFFTAAIPGALKSIIKLRAMTSILKIPLKYVFVAFPILLISTVIRSAYRLVLDIKAFRSKTYVQQYNTGEGDTLI